MSRGLCFFLIAAFMAALLPRPAAAQEDVTAASLEVIAAINQHRVNAGLHPLAVNPVLETMARAQADYVASLNFEPPNYDFHVDARGEYPRQRALRYNWPTYGDNKAQIEVNENAGLGDLNYVMDFWKNSAIHRQTMESPLYREIGVGLIPHKFGFLYIVVFGSQPNVFPVTVNPTNCQLYLPNEYHTGGNGTWIRSIQTVHMVDANGTALTQPTAWQPVMPVPPAAEFKVIFAENNQQVEQPVSLSRHLVILPDTLTATSSPCAATTTSTANLTSSPLYNSEINTVVGQNVYPATQPDTFSGAPTVIGKVRVDNGVNLQCREYPTSAAFSIALIPNTVEVMILGLPAPRDDARGYPTSHVLEFPDYSAILQPDIGIDNLPLGTIDTLWLDVEWWQPDGKHLACWVNADYIELFYQGTYMDDVSEYLQLVDKGILTLTPYNYPGGLRD